MYQWQESEDSVSTNRDSGDHDAHVEKSYSYATDWVDHHIDSSNFANTLGEEMRNEIYSAAAIVTSRNKCLNFFLFSPYCPNF